MKKIYFLLSFIFIASITLVSCDDEPLEGLFSVTGDGSDPNEPNPDSEACEVAFEVLEVAQINFGSTTEENFTQNCTAYSNALQATIAICGDASGELQAILISLGDCEAPDPCLQAEASANAALGALNNATEENEEQLCIAYSTALSAQIMACGDPKGNIQATIDALNCGGDCAAAEVATAEAQDIFNATDPLDEDAFTAACAAYSMALQAQIAACGDADGSLNDIVLDLGDCSPPEEDGPVHVFVDDVFTNFNTATVTINGSLLSVIATDADTGDTFTFDVVLQQTGDNIIQNTVLTIDGVVHSPSLTGMTPYINTITVNDGATIVGTFSGVFLRDGEEVITTEGIIDIAY